MAYTVTKIEENCWNADGSPIIICDCGHKHRTLTAAIKCRSKLLDYNRHTQTWSAKWHNARIFRDGKQVPSHEITEAEYQLHKTENW